ncbi:MAG TPA: hypothetical protein VNR11_18975 [Xanthobacteraceae bacterium]|nr:hypothetical protein [Xanthobacteraceae bacterium]
MRIFVFKSGAQGDLRAFTDDQVGSKLPEQFRPWLVTGAIAADSRPPHNFSRENIESAIQQHGFQLWRMKDKTTA